MVALAPFISAKAARAPLAAVILKKSRRVIIVLIYYCCGTQRTASANNLSVGCVAASLT